MPKMQNIGLGSLIRTLEPAAQRLHTFCRYFSAAGMVIFLLMVSLTFVDVFLRYCFKHPLMGTVEITELLMVIVVFSSIAYAQWAKCHVVMDMFTSSLQPNNKQALEAATTFWSLCVCVFSVYAASLYAMQTQSLTPLLRIPYTPFIWFVVVGLATLVFTLFWDFLTALDKAMRAGSFYGFAALVMGAMPVIFAWWLASHKLQGISAISIGVIGLVVMFALFLAGMPVAFSLMATGLIFSGCIRGMQATLNFYGKALFATSASYQWSPLMFFMLMGYFCFYGDLGRDLYMCARRWLGHYKGGLAQGSVCACATFGAVVGDNLSGTIAMSAIALPEMRSSGYDDSLSVGTLACAGTIGVLIPPSAAFILYGVLAEQSVSDLFMAGVFPGILCTLIFCFIIQFLVWRNPELARPLPKETLSVRLGALQAALPILLLFILVIGGIYGGVFTPTEGGSIGAVGTLLIALAMRRLTMKKLVMSLNDAAKFITMCFTVLTGAAVLSYFMTLSRIPSSLATIIADMGLGSGFTMLAIILVLFVLGCFVPAMPLMLVCVPIFVPVANLFHWDLIWFGVLIVMMMNMASITPPFGINLFVMKAVANVHLNVVFRGSWPFIFGLGLVIALVILFPSIATWLPSVLR